MRYFVNFFLAFGLLIGLSSSAEGQNEWGLELGINKPTGNLGYRFNASPSLRLTRSFGDTDQLFQRRGFVGVEYFIPQEDTVNIGYYVGRDPLTNTNDNDIFVGTREINEFAGYVVMGGQALVRPWRKSVFRPYGIVELQGKIGYFAENVLSAGADESLTGGDMGASAGIGGGLEYLSDGKYTFYANVVRTYGYTYGLSTFAFWNTGLGFTYLF
ncbi:hypothetical protein [Lewinella sp. 4G2]|uniref:hypothetical protein n=1 Tax=Lewinella sp. 4G2 TaxID=1803372 RepID=UPI0007B4E4BD|nr:hypothetical protein [Lewinella sp. 4G2]OAV44792.1 hypothetical protein A3850_009955 [Lewinella sp. 4G2]